MPLSYGLKLFILFLHQDGEHEHADNGADGKSEDIEHPGALHGGEYEYAAVGSHQLAAEDSGQSACNGRTDDAARDDLQGMRCSVGEFGLSIQST